MFYIYVWILNFVYIHMYIYMYHSYPYICTTHLLDCASPVLRSLPPVFYARQHLLDCLHLQNLHHAGVWCPRTRILHHCHKQYHHPRTSSSLWFNVIDGCRNRAQEFVDTVEPAPDVKIINVEREVFQLLGRFSVCVLFDLEKLVAVPAYLCKCVQVQEHMYVHNHIHMNVREYMYTYIHIRIYTISSRWVRLWMRRSNIEAAYANRVFGNNINIADFALTRALKSA